MTGALSVVAASGDDVDLAYLRFNVALRYLALVVVADDRLRYDHAAGEESPRAAQQYDTAMAMTAEEALWHVACIREA